jgi:ubiquinone biosynthesis protein
MLSVVTAVRDADRLRQIVVILVKHGFGDVIARIGLGGLAPASKEGEERKKITFAERLRVTLQDLGPSFIKLGQIVSTRADLLPPEVISELKKLQDDVPPMPIAEVRATIEETLGSPVDEVYRGFEEKPLACASIGQVHRARLPQGDGETDVVVKVQRTRARETIERDLDLLYLLARLIERAIPESKIYSPVGLVGEFDRSITTELDFTIEADNAEVFSKNFAESAMVRFPRVYREVSGKKVLTLEYFAGKKIDAAIAAGVSGKAIARRALQVIAQMVFEDGFFHADPHPGNVLILGEGEEPILGLLDLGLVGRLTEEMRDRIVELMAAAIRTDTEAMADALLAIGRPRAKVDLPAFRAEVERIAQRYLGKALREIEVSALIRDLVQGAVKFEIEMPTELTMMGKALMTVEGVGKEIDPELDVYAELRPYFLRLFMRRFHPDRLGRDLLRGMAQLGTTASNLPRQVHEILEDLRTGRLEVRAADPGLPKAADRLGRRIFAAVAVGAFTLSGTGLLAVGRHETVGGVLLGLAGAQLLLHLLGDWRR